MTLAFKKTAKRCATLAFLGMVNRAVMEQEVWRLGYGEMIQ